MSDLKKVPEKQQESLASAKDLEKESNTAVVDKQEKEYNIEVIRDYYGQIDPFYLSQKDPNYAYRFLRDEHKNLSMKTGNLLFQKGGWQICPKEHLLRLGLKEKDISPDGLLRRGDTILAFMPMKLFQEKEQYKVKRANEPISQIKRLIKEGDPTKGGKELHDTMKGIQTQKQLGM